MKLDDLIGDWKTKYGQYIVRFEQLADSAKTAARVKKNYAVWYKWSNTDNTVRFRQFGVWVINPDTDSEEAYFDGGEPNISPPQPAPTPFVKEVNNEIQNLVNSGDIDSGIVNTIDEDTKTAEATIYIMEVDGVSKHIWRFKKEDDGSISHEEVTS